MHLAVGFENGIVEVRSHRTGKQVHKVCVGSSPIQKLFYYDYRQTGVNEQGKQVIAVNSDGAVQGFSVSQSIQAYEMEIMSEEKIQADKVLELN